MGLTYRDSGVDIEGGNSFVKRISPLVKKTFSERVLTGIGGFGALFNGSFPEMDEPVLVSGTDGVGTKLKIAQMMDKHDTIGIDAVAMCVNDIVTSGAQPLFFLDYISCGKLDEDTMTALVSGIAEGCLQASCSLIGGETAEHPDVMEQGDYDIAGFSVGVVDRKNIIDGTRIKAGDTIIGLPSTGIHSNGYSMVRKLFLTMKGYSLDKHVDDLGCTLGEALLEPTAIYIKPLMKLLAAVPATKGLVHITGGGFYENIPRILPQGTGAVIDYSSLVIPPVFNLIQEEGEVEQQEMFTTFNMGTGMMIFADKDDTDKSLEVLEEAGTKPVIIGEVVEGQDDPVVIK